MGTILIVSAAVTWTHKEIRLREPANWASKVGAIDGKDLEILTIHISDPTGNIRRLPIPGIHHRISIRSQPGLTCGKLFQSAQR